MTASTKRTRSTTAADAAVDTSPAAGTTAASPASDAPHVSVTPDVLMPEKPASDAKGRTARGRTARGRSSVRVVRDAVVERGQSGKGETDGHVITLSGGAGGRPDSMSGSGPGGRSGGRPDDTSDTQDELDVEVLLSPEEGDEPGDELDAELDGGLDDELEGAVGLDVRNGRGDDGEDDGSEARLGELSDGLSLDEGTDGEARYLTERTDSGATLPAPAGNRLPQVRDNFQIYVREVCRFPLLKPEEEHELAVKFRDTQDKEAAFKLISSHLRLVVKIAMDFQRRWMQNVLDLVQEGNVGLIHALYKFDPDKGIKFSYYSSFWIKAYILKFIMDNFRMVKIGTTQVQRKLFFNLNRERQKLIAQGFNPDAEMLSQHLGVSKNDILEMEQRLSASDVSLNVPVSDENDSASRMDFLPALDPGIEESIASEEISDMLHAKLKTLLPKLSEKELYILNNRLFTDSPETLREIGERYHITRERVRQLEIRLLEKIKKHLAGDIHDFSRSWIQS